LRDAEDVIVMTKDSDFVDLSNRFGAPPRITLLTCGNTSNARLKEILSSTLLEALDFLRTGEVLVEVRGD
jgi:predicted nuclease of predicted toxin-antitoxin system